MARVPFLGRLYLREYIAVFFSCIFIAFEGILSIVVACLPRTLCQIVVGYYLVRYLLLIPVFVVLCMISQGRVDGRGLCSRIDERSREIHGGYERA